MLSAERTAAKYAKTQRRTTHYGTRADYYNATSGDRVWPSAAPRVLLAFRAAAATHPGPLGRHHRRPSSASQPLPPPLPPRYISVYRARRIAALIYRRRRAQLIRLCSGTETNTHTHAEPTFFFIPVYTHIHGKGTSNITHGCDRFSFPSAPPKNIPYTTCHTPCTLYVYRVG